MKFALVLAIPVILFIVVAADSPGPGGPVTFDWSPYQEYIALWTNAAGVDFWSRIDEFIPGEDIENPCESDAMLNKVSVCHGTTAGDYVRSGCQQVLQEGSTAIPERKVVMNACPKAYSKCKNVAKTDSRGKGYVVAVCCDDLTAVENNCKEMAHDESG